MRYRIGITGSIGSGKSTLARLLCEQLAASGHPATLLDADRVAREVLHSSDQAAEVAQRLVERFGREILDPNGKLDRAALAARAFADDDTTAALNAIVHPYVIGAFAAATAADGLYVLDVPLLFESGLDRMCDVTICVTAPREERHRRAARFADVAEREKRQWSEERKAAKADHVVPNDDTPEELASRTIALCQKLLTGIRGI